MVNINITSYNNYINIEQSEVKYNIIYISKYNKTYKLINYV